MCLNDHHPDAHACRARIALNVEDSAIFCPWDIVLDAAKLTDKLPRVSARCRLSLIEEARLLKMCSGLSVKSKHASLVNGG